MIWLLLSTILFGHVLAREEFEPEMFSFRKYSKEVNNLQNLEMYDKFQNSEKLRELFSGNGLFLNSVESFASRRRNKLLYSPVFPDVSLRCITDSLAVMDAASKYRFWALQVVDSTGRNPPGLLAGNFFWLGYYDECFIEVPRKNLTEDFAEDHGYLTTKYCKSDIEYIGNDTNSGKEALYSHVIYGYCVPSTCNDTESEAIINFELKAVYEGTDMKVKNAKCQTEHLPFNTRAIGFMTFCGIWGLIVVIATVYDAFTQWVAKAYSPRATYTNDGIVEYEYKENPEKIPLILKDLKLTDKDRKSFGERLLLCFSLYTNGEKLLNVKQDESTLKCIDGIRFLSMAWVIVGHVYSYGIRVEGNLTLALEDFNGDILYQVVQSASLSVDTFFVLSGLLLSYLLLKELKKRHGKINWAVFYLHRYIRLTPVYMIVFFFVSTTYVHFSNGPLWDMVDISDECMPIWWRKLLYIDNFFEKKCFNIAWYLCNDMQFFIISPLIVVPLYYSKTVGLFLIFSLTFASMVTTSILSYVYKFSAIGHVGADTTPGISAFETYYIKPYCRIGPYLIGILTGWIMYEKGSDYKIKKLRNLACWAIATILGLLVVYGMYKNENDQRINGVFGYMYVSTFRTVWGACVCWVIFACVTGNGGFVNSILSWQGFIPLSRLTYCAYLINANVIRLYFRSRRTPYIARRLVELGLNLSCILLSFMTAAIVSLIFESPIMRMEGILLPRKSRKPKAEVNGHTTQKSNNEKTRV